MALLAVDEASGVFARVSPDNHLRLFNSETGDRICELVEDDHLSAAYTCLALGGEATKMNSKKASKKKKKRKSKKNTSLCAAVGSQSGKITVWDVASGTILHRLTEGHSQRVNDVVFGHGGAVLYSCSDDKMICEWNVRSGALQMKWKAGKRRPVRLCVDPSGDRLISASSSIRLWDLSSHKVLSRFSGHGTPVSCLAFAQAGDDLFVSGAQGDRFLSVWRADGSTPMAVQSMALQDSPAEVVFTGALVAAVTTAGRLELFDRQAEGGEGINAKPAATFRVSDSKRPIIGCGVLSAGDGDDDDDGDDDGLNGHAVASTLVLVRDGPVLAFERRSVDERGDIDLDATDAEPEEEEEEEEEEEKQVKKTKKKKAKKRKRALFSGDDDEGDKKEKGPTVLDVSDLPVPKAHKARHAQGVRRERAADFVVSPAPATAAAAGSLQEVLSQALKSGDKGAIEQCLACREAAVIGATIDRLPTLDVMPLLKQLMDTFQDRPKRATQLIDWIEAVLQRHTAYLMSLPELPSLLQGLYQVVDYRLSVFKKLLTLTGRLDLLFHQVDLQAARREEHQRANQERNVTVWNEEETLVKMDGIEEDDDDDDDDSSGSGDSSDNDDDDE